MNQRKHISILTAFLAAVGLCACTAKKTPQASAAITPSVPAEQTPAVTAAAGTAADITADEAKKIALAHAGLSEAEVTFLRSETDYEHGKTQYEIEFYRDSMEYDYHIDAKTGEILSFEQETKGIAASTKPNAGATGRITEDEAYEIALSHAKISRDAATLKKNKIDRDDGKEIFEIEFYAGGKEYEYEIDAKDGTIVKYEIDS